MADRWIYGGIGNGRRQKTKHSQIKLEQLQKYLKAYRQMFTQNECAPYFRTWYADAFAGTGSRGTDNTPPGSALLRKRMLRERLEFSGRGSSLQLQPYEAATKGRNLNQVAA